jgi:PAS domain S-box-containing protein
MESTQQARAGVAQLTFSLPLEPSRLLRARDRIRDYLQQYCSDQNVIDEVVLCVEEACTNVIRHSGSRKKMQISLRFDGDDLLAEVRDSGRAFDTDSFDAGIVPDVTRSGGRGLFLMAHLMDQLTLLRDRGLDVRMVKKGVSRSCAAPIESGLGDLSAVGQSAHRETRLRALLEEIDEAFLALDWEYRYVYANSSAERLTGRSRAELLGRRPWEVFPKLAGSEVDHAYHEAMELGKPSVLEYRSVLTGDWLEVRVYPTAAGISAYFRGINDRVRVQTERERLLGDLQAQGEELQSLTKEVHTERAQLISAIEQTETCIVLLDTDFNFVLVNSAYAETCGYRPEEMVGLNHFDLYPHDENEAIFRTVRDTGMPVEFVAKPFEFPDQPERGVTYWDWRLAPIAAAEGEVEGLVFSLVDVTQRVRAQRFSDALNEINAAVNSRLDRSFILQSVLELAGEAFGCDAGNVAVKDGDDWMPTHVWRMPGEFVGERYPSAEVAYAEQALVERRPVLLEDYANHPLGNRELAERFNVGATLAIPLFVAEQPIGALFFTFYGPPHHYDDAEVDFARKVGAAVSRALENARLYDEGAQRERMSAALNDIAASITLFVDYDEILTRVVAQAGAALSAESSSICTLEDDAWVPRYLWQLPDDVTGVPIPRERVSYANIGVESREPVAIDDCESDPRVDLELQRSWNVRSVAMAPLLVRDTAAAAIFFNYHTQAHTFTAHEVDFIGKAAAIISGALENARLLQQLDRVATTLQENLVHPLPDLPRLELGRVSETAFAPDRVGGDFSDVFAIDEFRVATVIGDVGGKGIRAAGLTETVHTAVNSFALVDTSPAFILRKTNQLLLRSTGGDEQLVTAFLLVVDLRTGEVSYASAGHPAPAVVGKVGCALIDVPFGLPLGTFACDYSVGHMTLDVGETLVLYTDGVIEARRDGELFGEQRLLEAVSAARHAAPQMIAERLRHAAVEFAGRLKDDLHVLALRRSGAAGA